VQVTDSARNTPVLPEWPPGTVLILVSAGTPPHAIPVSAALRAGPERVLLGLARSRESLARLRRDPRVALTIMAGGDVAVTVYGTAHVREADLTDGVAALELRVDRVQDHNRPTFVIDSGVGWHWTDAAAQERDGEVRRALQRLAKRL
jgi:hypothetical protein